uniref:ATP synthase complex subunit 8 n=1 Tax=Geron pallipilosus TaxID=2682726 RepID=A0A6B9P575_9MUSC|nr:ATP synthase F0 subunit 8 [Geron pallipilosus]
MPQMAPMSWLTLFLIFSISLILFNMVNYFSFINLTEKKPLSLKFMKKSLEWKW